MPECDPDSGFPRFDRLCAGGGGNEGKSGSGAGTGGGVNITPVAFISIIDDRVQVHPVEKKRSRTRKNFCPWPRTSLKSFQNTWGKKNDSTTKTIKKKENNIVKSMISQQ